MQFRGARRRKGEQGYILLVILLFLSLLLMGALIAAPRIGQQIQREREDELIKRGTQYARAIGRFYKKFGRYPTRLEELENTNNIRFLRRRYPDPITGKADWRLVYFGQQRSMPRGFGGGVGGPAPVLPGAAPAGGPGGGAQPQAPGTSAESMSRPLGSGQTFGGGPIIGVASKSEATSIKEINGKSRYNEWEFIYDPRLDPALQGRGGGVPQPGQPGQPQPGQPQRGPGLPPGPQSPGPATPRQ